MNINPRISVITSLYKCEKYLDQYFQSVEKITNKQECEFILIHNDPTPQEEKIISEHLKNKSYYRYYAVPRESLYASWNRAVTLANAEYVANWNVDDIRTPDSLAIQAAALDNQPNAAIAYGNTVTITDYNNFEDGIVNEEVLYSESTKAKFRHSFYISCFPMWRKRIHENIGYFDEQFFITGDFEFQVRAAHLYDFVKVNKILGYFYGGSPGERLSQQSDKQAIENVIVYLRYGNYFKMNLPAVGEALKKEIFNIKYKGKFIPIEKYIPDYKKLHISRLLYHLPYNLLIYFPIDLFRKIKRKI